MSGQGTFHYANGDIYKGQWQSNQAHGYGVYMHENGATYEGDWQDYM